MVKPTIALLTDFGLTDNYVGIMKGVILAINPEARLVDLTHEIEVQNVFQAALVLKSAYRYFAKGTIFLCVVDPGVGSLRQAIIVQAGEHFFVGPDNGIFSFVVAEQKTIRIWTITNVRYFLNPVSRTFHGRDIFAPVAAHLSKGTTPGRFGPRQTGLVRLAWPRPKISKDGREILGQIVDIDRFGNLITNIENEKVLAWSGKMVVIIKGRKIGRIAMSYTEGKNGELLALPGSKDLLEISVNRGSAQKALHGQRGDLVRISSFAREKWK